MSTDEKPTPKGDALGQMWEILTTLTDEAMAVATAKCEEAGFDANRGVVPLREGFINLSAARVLLEDAIKKKKLIQLPITVQNDLLSHLQAIAKSLQGLSTGVDEVANLSESIEALNTSIWKYGLHNLSPEVLGYQTKLNQLKNQELRIADVTAKLEEAQAAADQANLAASEIEQKKSESAALLEQLKDSAGTSVTLLDRIKDAETKTSVLFATVQQNEKQSGELTSNIKTASNELSSFDASIKKFYGEVDEYRRKINQTSDDASKLITSSEQSIKKMTDDGSAKVDEAIKSLQENAATSAAQLTSVVDVKAAAQQEAVLKFITDRTTEVANLQAASETRSMAALKQVDASVETLVNDTLTKVKGLEERLALRSNEIIEANQTKTNELIRELALLKDQIRDQIQQATGFQLFGAFQSRQNEIAISKKRWVYAIILLVVISAGVTVLIAYEAQSYNSHSLAFWIKLSLTIPLGYAITFCTVQYGKERRLEEEYAFKASISASLNPYRDMVQSILDKDGSADHAKYTDFVIESVKNIFSTPTDKIFDTEKKAGITEKALKQTAEIIGTAVKASK